MEVKIGEVNNGLIPVKIAQMLNHVLSVAKENKIASGQWKDWYIQTLLCIHDSNDSNSNDKDNTKETKWQEYDMNVSKMEYNQLTEERSSAIFGFYIRVPFYFIEYEIDLKFRLFNNKLNKSQLETFKSESSQIFTIKVPSFLIEARFEVGQPIIYVIPDAHYVCPGKILQIIENGNDEKNDASDDSIQRKDTVTGSGGLDDTTNDTINTDNKGKENKNKKEQKETDKNKENKDNNENNENNSGNDTDSNVNSKDSSKETKNDDDDENNSDATVGKENDDNDYLGSNVRYLIELDPNYTGIDYSKKEGYIFTVDSRQIYPKKVSSNFTVNIINRKEIECDFILCNNNSKIRQYYWDLRNIISNYYQTILKDYIEFEKKKYWRLIHRYDFDLIGALFSNILCQYLYDLDENDNNNNTLDYKIRCFINSSFNSDDGMIFNANHWSYMIRRRIDAIASGVKVGLDTQAFATSGWNCDMCRCSIHINDWCFHCSKDRRHDYCINCTYSMANEIIKFEHYLQDIIHTIIDSEFTMDCIQVLVAFVCGYAKKSC